MTRMPGYRQSDLLRANRAARGLDTGNFAFVPDKASHLALLDEVHAMLIGATRETPRDGIVSRGTCAPLHNSAMYRKSGVGRIIEVWDAAHDFRAVKKL